MTRTVDASPASHSAISLRPYQEEAMAAVQKEYENGTHRTAISLATGLGKAQPVSEPVLTPKGWVKIGDLRIGDEVIGSGGRRTKITGVFPQGILPIYRMVLQDGAAVLCSLQHLWAVQDAHQENNCGQGDATSAEFVVRTTAELLEKPLRFGSENCHRYFLPVLAGHIDFDPVELPLEPYTRGVLIGDGSLPLHERTPRQFPFSAPIKGTFIPEQYFLGSDRQRLALLHGLMDAATCTHADYEYCTTSLRLALDVEQLVRSLGGSFARIAVPRTDSGAPLHRIDIALPPSRSTVPTRAIETIAYVSDMEAVCIAVDAPDQLYVTSDYILTHNTIIFSTLADHFVRDLGQRVLVMAHRTELIDQAVAKLIQVRGNAEDIGIVRAQENVVDTPITVASIQTVSRTRRLDQLEQYGLIIIDEAHHAASDSYMKVLKDLGAFTADGPRLLGVSATIRREDNKDLSKIFESIAYEMGILAGIQQDYLCDIKAIEVLLKDLFLDDIKLQNGDFAPGDLDRALQAANTPTHIVEAYKQHATGRKAMVFVPNVDMAYAVANRFGKAGIPAFAADATTPRESRRRMLEHYRKGEYMVNVNVGLFTEGFDLPSIDCIVLGTPTVNLTKIAQCLDAKTQILTPSGWASMGEVHKGDLVAGFDINSETISWVEAEEIVQRPLSSGERMFGISSPTLDIRVTDAHRMVYKTRGGINYRHKFGNDSRPWEFITASELENLSEVRIPTSGVQESEGLPLTLDDMVFLGIYSAEGSLTPSHAVIYQDINSPELNEIRTCLEATGLQYKEKLETSSTIFKAEHTMVKFHLARGLRTHTITEGKRGFLGLLPYMDKDLSPLMDAATPLQLAMFLYGLHMGDGAKQKGQGWTRRSYHISTVNRVFADRLQSLCVRKGFKCNVATIKEASYVGNDVYNIHIKINGRTRLLKGKGAKKDRELFGELPSLPGELVWCVENKLSTLVTRRNGKVAILGNCIGRGTRKWPGKKDCLVIDMVGTAKKRSIASTTALFNVNAQDLQEHGLRKAVVLKKECDEEEVRKKEEEIVKGTTVVRPVDLFRLPEKPAAEQFSWISSFTPGIYYLSLPNGVVEVSTSSSPVQMALGQDTEDTLTYNVIVREKGKPVHIVAVGQSLSYAQGIAEDYVRKQGATNLAAINSAWRARPASAAQIKLLHELGVEQVPPGFTSGEASDLITLKKADGLRTGGISVRFSDAATPAQIRYLKVLGYRNLPPSLTKKEAGEMINRRVQQRGKY